MNVYFADMSLSSLTVMDFRTFLSILRRNYIGLRAGNFHTLLSCCVGTPRLSYLHWNTMYPFSSNKLQLFELLPCSGVFIQRLLERVYELSFSWIHYIDFKTLFITIFSINQYRIRSRMLGNILVESQGTSYRPNHKFTITSPCLN